MKHWFDIDLFKAMSSDDVAFVGKMFARRHVCEHNERRRSRRAVHPRHRRYRGEAETVNPRDSRVGDVNICCSRNHNGKLPHAVSRNLSARPEADLIPSAEAERIIQPMSKPREKVGQLNMPILIITGEHTIKIHKLGNEELARILPQAECAIIPKAGHGSAREHPEAFNNAVLEFLARLPRRSAPALCAGD